MITQQQYNDAVATKKTLEGLGLSVPQGVLDLITEYESSQITSAISETPIYSKLKKEAQFPVSEEKEACITETVAELLSDAPNASDPGLLLGKIQCGKTDTFENIIGLAFDRGIDIAIVITKGTKALVDQTIKRMREDYRWFKESDNLDTTASIIIEDIMENKKGFNVARINRAKTVIVAKKEVANLKHLINVFKNLCPWLQDKKVLIVDDEADFASRNYRSVRRGVLNDEEGNAIPQKGAKSLAKVSKLIDELRQLPKYCRYLQVTATPYCLFLQPDGKIDVEGGVALPFRPRFTKLVPIHNKYIGGKEYFVTSLDDTSMFSHLFWPVTQKCINVLGHEDRRYLKSGIASGNILGLTKALIAYIMATAVRRIQRRAENKSYQSSCVLHVNIDKENHNWQSRLVNFMLEQIKQYFNGEKDLRLDFMVNETFSDFEKSNNKAQVTGKENPDGSVTKISVGLPSLTEIKAEVATIFNEGDINMKVINSDNDVASLLDRDNGQLRLDSSANIFIGGSILDRGITIKNMLCFFYGRDPKKFQQDTVLQHARFYGARDLEDMAVTRLHTTPDIYRELARMNELDDQLRQWFLNGMDKEDPHVTFVGYDRNIQPCAPSKISPSKAITITSQKRFVPKGMMTGTKKEISNTIKEITDLIESAPGYPHKDENGIFEMDSERAMQILRLIQSTYRYDQDNKMQKDDMRELISALHFCAHKAGGNIWILHRTDRNMSRKRDNGAWIDAPEDGRTDLIPGRAKAIDRPLLMLFLEAGDKKQHQVGTNPDGSIKTENYGWNGTPFYWPSLLTQANIDPVLFATGQKDDGETVTIDLSKLTKGINPDDILSLSYSTTNEPLIERFGEVGTEYPSATECEVETRHVRDTTWTRFFEKNSVGEPMLTAGVQKDNKWAGIYTYNNGILPFVLRPYKYILLRTGGRTGISSAMLLEIFPTEDWNIFAYQNINERGELLDFQDEKLVLLQASDVEMDRRRATREVLNVNVCQWIIEYPIKKVLRYQTVGISEQPEESTSVGD